MTSQEKYRAKIRAIVDDIKSVPCMDCGGTFPPIAMQFDHKDPSQKLDSVARLVNNTHSLEKVLAEIEKCDIVCANCHLIRTYKISPHTNR